MEDKNQKTQIRKDENPSHYKRPPEAIRPTLPETQQSNSNN